MGLLLTVWYIVHSAPKLLVAIKDVMVRGLGEPLLRPGVQTGLVVTRREVRRRGSQEKEDDLLVFEIGDDATSGD